MKLKKQLKICRSKSNLSICKSYWEVRKWLLMFKRIRFKKFSRYLQGNQVLLSNQLRQQNLQFKLLFQLRNQYNLLSKPQFLLKNLNQLKFQLKHQFKHQFKPQCMLKLNLKHQLLYHQFNHQLNNLPNKRSKKLILHQTKQKTTKFWNTANLLLLLTKNISKTQEIKLNQIL